VRLPVHQWTDAVRLFEPWRYGSGKLPDVGVSEHGPYSPSGSTSSTSTTRDVGVFAAARAPRLSLRKSGLADRPPAWPAEFASASDAPASDGHGSLPKKKPGGNGAAGEQVCAWIVRR
jgi:hypothetical protein